MRKIVFPRNLVWVGECCYPIPVKRTGADRLKFSDPTKRNDYIGVKIEGERWPAHRLSYCLNVAFVPRSLERRKDGLVLHHCDNKWCINPEHLYLGTSKQNAQDNAVRNKGWLEKRKSIQKEKGFPPVSKEGRSRMARANSERMKVLWATNPEEARRQRGLL